MNDDDSNVPDILKLFFNYITEHLKIHDNDPKIIKIIKQIYSFAFVAVLIASIIFLVFKLTSDDSADKNDFKIGNVGENAKIEVQDRSINIGDNSTVIFPIITGNTNVSEPTPTLEPTFTPTPTPAPEPTLTPTSDSTLTFSMDVKSTSQIVLNEIKSNRFVQAIFIICVIFVLIRFSDELYNLAIGMAVIVLIVVFMAFWISWSDKEDNSYEDTTVTDTTLDKVDYRNFYNDYDLDKCRLSEIGDIENILNQYNKNEIEYIIQEIIARAGYYYKNENTRKKFEGTDWYNPDYEKSEAEKSADDYAKRYLENINKYLKINYDFLADYAAKRWP